MTIQPALAWRFVSFAETEVERLPGKTHHGLFMPGMVADTHQMFVRADLPPGEAHRFRSHRKKEEILYGLAGTAEHWVERENRMRSGDSLALPAGLVHATCNASGERLAFPAMLSPAKSGGPVTVEVGDEEPWKSLQP